MSMTKKKNKDMTEQRKKEICIEYAKYRQNFPLSDAEHRRMEELEAEAMNAGFEFYMTNRTQYMLPHFLGEPKYKLVYANTEYNSIVKARKE